MSLVIFSWNFNFSLVLILTKLLSLFFYSVYACSDLPVYSLVSLLLILPSGFHLFFQKVHSVKASRKLFWQYIFFSWASQVVPVVKNSPENAGDMDSIPGSRRSPGWENGTPLQYSCLWNPIDRGAWLATVHGATKSSTRLNDWALFFTYDRLSLER